MRAIPAARELTFGFAVLLSLQLLTSFGAIYALNRMSPAIERIRRENVASVEAVEEMLDTLARRQAGGDAAALERRYRRALARAQGNVTEETERAPLRVLAADGPRAFAADSGALLRTIDALRELSRINREAMRERDDEVKRLGTGGAWAVAFLGMLGLMASVLAMRRTRRGLLEPMAEVRDVLDAHRQGDPWRRCTVVRYGSEWQPLMTALNELLDRAARNAR